MARAPVLTPVDYDPFAPAKPQTAQRAPSYTPVDYDPFAPGPSADGGVIERIQAGNRARDADIRFRESERSKAAAKAGSALPNPDAPEDDWLTAIRKTGQNFITGAKQAVAGGLQALVETTPEGLDAFAAERGGGATVQTPVGDTLRAAISRLDAKGQVPGQAEGKALTAQLEANAVNAPAWSAKGIGSNVAISLAQMLPGTAVSALTRSPVPALGSLGAQVFGQQYAQSRAEGRNSSEARLDAAFYTAAELIPEHKVISEIISPAGKTALTRALRVAGAEGLSEGITQVLQDGYAAGVVGKDMTFGEAIDNIALAAVTGAFMGGGLSVATEPFQKRAEAHAEAAASAPAPGALEGIPRPPEQPPTPGDIASPINTGLITQGRAEIEHGAAILAANDLLAKQGMPAVGSRVTATYPDGRTLAGKIQNAYEVASNELGLSGSGIKIDFDDGTSFDDLFSTAQKAGVTFAPEGPAPAPEASNTTGTGLLPQTSGPKEFNLAELMKEREQAGQQAVAGPLVGDGTRAKPVIAEHGDHVDAAAAVANPAPTEAQKEAGNYTKGHVRVGGLDVTIENARDSERSGTDPDGKPWSVKMPAHYGYVKRTTGADDEQVDVYIGPNPQAPRVWVVDQVDAASGAFDEHKGLIGFDSRDEALTTYDAGFSDGKGPQRRGAVTEMSLDEFKALVQSGDLRSPLGTLGGGKPAVPEVLEELTRAWKRGVAKNGEPYTPEQREQMRQLFKNYGGEAPADQGEAQPDMLGGPTIETPKPEPTQAEKYAEDEEAYKKREAREKRYRRGAAEALVKAFADGGTHVDDGHPAIQTYAVNIADALANGEYHSNLDKPLVRKALEAMTGRGIVEGQVEQFLKTLARRGTTDPKSYGTALAFDRGAYDVSKDGVSLEDRRATLAGYKLDQLLAYHEGRAWAAEQNEPKQPATRDDPLSRGDRELFEQLQAENANGELDDDRMELFLRLAKKAGHGGEAGAKRDAAKQDAGGTGAPPIRRVFVNYVGRDGLTDEERGGPLPPEADAAATIEDMPSGKSVIVKGATPAQLEAIKAALPAGVAPVYGKSAPGSPIYSKKHEGKIRLALGLDVQLAPGVPNAPTAGARGPLTAPAAAKTRESRDAERTMRDWSNTVIPNYDDPQRSEGDGGETKEAFLTDAFVYASAIARILGQRGFAPHLDRKGRPDKAVTIDRGGPAVSGDVTLRMVREDGSGVYMDIGTAMATPNGGISVMARGATREDRYGTGQGAAFRNQWLRTDMPAAEMADELVKIADEVRGVGAAPAPKSNAPEHAAVGVDDRELSQIVGEFNAAQQSAVQDDYQVTHVFDPPASNEVVRLADKVRVWNKDHGWMTPAEAKAKIAEWKAHAAAQGETRANASRVVLSLFDLTGKWSQPWEDAGYQVYRFDIQADPDMGDVNNFSTEFFSDWFGDFDGQDIYAILAACPCTDFASSGARHFAAKDADGRTVASVKLVHQTLAAIEYFKPAVWAIENPVGRIEKLGGLPPWRLSFDPNHLGETYTKKTLLWGRFNADMPIAPVEPTEGSKMHLQFGGSSLATKNARSATPEGFAYSFFMANNAVDHPAMAIANKFDRLDRELIERAVAAGVTEEQIARAVEDFYYQELDDAAANAAIRALIPGGAEPRGTATVDTAPAAGDKGEPQPGADNPNPAPSAVRVSGGGGNAAKPADYGASNKLVTADRAAELRAKLKAKLSGQVNAGIDPELIAMGTELAVFHIEAGARRFGEWARAMSADLGMSLAQLRPYLRSWYNGARDYMEDLGEPVGGMDGPDQVRDMLKTLVEQEQADGRGATENREPAGDMGAGGEQAPVGEGGRAGEPAGNRDDSGLASAPPEDGGGAGTAGGARSAGARSGGTVSRPAAGEPRRRDDGDRGQDGSGQGANAGAGTGVARKAVPAGGRPDFYVSDPASMIGGGPKARFARNVAAIEAFNEITAEGREPTPDELAAMAGYTGWGSFGQELFNGSWEYPSTKPGWEAENKRLRDLLGEEAWKSAQSSILNAHYTDPPTVMMIWDAVRAMGFTGGRVLEPSLGIGNFFSLMPRDLHAASDLTGIELDTTTGGMAKLLYPQANIQIKGYQDSATRDDFYDLIIGNWPFARQAPATRRYARLHASLHDFFFVKALDQVRPGGLVVGITSAGTLDKEASQVREALHAKADLVAAFRLPSGAFGDYAGTNVVTDLIILRKVAPGASRASIPEWLGIADASTPAGVDIRVNAYLKNKPSHVLGTLNFGSGSTYGRPSMIVDRPADYPARLARIPSMLPQGIYTPFERGNEPRFISNNTKDREGSITAANDGELYVVRGERLELLADLLPKVKIDTAEVSAMVNLAKLYGALLDAEREGGDEADRARTALRTAYEAFVKSNGRVGKAKSLRSVFVKVGDPAAAILEALETADGKPSRIMREAITRSGRKTENPNVREAFAQARNSTLYLDMNHIAELAKTTPEAAAAELLAAGAVYRLPGGGFEVSDIYLSGNVRRKMREAEEALAAGEPMEPNIAALKRVMPKDVPHFQITTAIGATWVPVSDYVDFVAFLLGRPALAEYVLITHKPGTAAAWKVRFDDTRKQMIRNSPEATTTWGVDDVAQMPFDRLLTMAFNNGTPKIFHPRQEDGSRPLNTEATERAEKQIVKIKEAFSGWLWSDPLRLSRLEEAYNETMNAIAEPNYDGSFLDMSGMALHRGEDQFGLRKHQLNAIWRGIVNGRGLYAHEVGTGKTYTMAGIAVESRRYGRAQKPLILAHNANSRAVYNEFKQMYPGASVLYVGDLSPDTRATTLRRIKNEDWDAVVMPHSVIDRLALREDTAMELAREQIAALEAAAIEAANDDNSSVTVAMMDNPDQMKKVRSPTAKDLVRSRNAIIERVRRMALASSKEGAVPIEDLGIDMVIVDEAHEFKKPPVETRMRVRGLQTATSGRSIALDFLLRYVQSRNDGRGVHLFTGTPITNTITEMFAMQRYVMGDEMRMAGVDMWDAWAANFTRVTTEPEVSAAGDMEDVQRLSAFTNVAELRRMVGQVMDTVFADDMPEFKPRAAASGKTLRDKGITPEERKELRDGRSEQPQGRPYRQTISDSAPMSPEQEALFADLKSRVVRWRNMRGKDRVDEMRSYGPSAPLRISNEAAAATLDIRLHDPQAFDDPRSKVNRAVKRIMHHYREHPLASQVVFVDRGYDNFVERKGERVPVVNLVKDLVAKLVEQGIPESEIAIVKGGVTAERKAEIAAAVDAGKIRVVIGQTGTLGTGVNMQSNLRAMHHLDAPWMPGELTQRNGRGWRQGNKWNTVMEYRYITTGIDGKRWQVLTVKDRFITRFLKAKVTERDIDGDAVDSSSEDDIGQTLVDALGDPRIGLRRKITGKIAQLEQRRNYHASGARDAVRRAEAEQRKVEEASERLTGLAADATYVQALREAKTFTATIEGKEYDERPKAEEALEAAVRRFMQIMPRPYGKAVATVQGFDVVLDYNTKGHAQFVVQREGRVPVNSNSLPGVEAVIRAIPATAEALRKAIAEGKETIERLGESAKTPFAQGDEIVALNKRLAEIDEDIDRYPAPAPEWMADVAPIDSEAYIDGKPFDVGGHRWGKDNYYVLDKDGTPHPYNRLTDEAGNPLYEPVPFQEPVAAISKTPPKASLRDAESRRGEVDDEGRSPIDFERMARDLARRLEKLGLDDKIALKLVDAVRSGEGGEVNADADGMYVNRLIQVASDSRNGLDTLNHEAIHAMRDLGLFKPAEWRSLEHYARGDLRAMAETRRLYAGQGLTENELVEEVIAQKFADFAAERAEPKGFFRTAFERIRDFLAAVYDALSGNGYPTARAVLAAVDRGAIGRRQSSAAAPSDRPRFDLGAGVKPMADDELAERLAALGIAKHVAMRVVSSTELGGAAGRYEPLFLRISVASDAGDLIGTLNHEAIHAMRDLGLFTVAEWKALAAHYRSDRWMVERVERMWGDHYRAKYGLTEANIAIMLEEEGVAELFREHAKGQALIAEHVPNAPLWQRIIVKVVVALQVIREYLSRGSSSYRTMQRIERGEIGSREPNDSAPTRRRFTGSLTSFDLSNTPQDGEAQTATFSDPGVEARWQDARRGVADPRTMVEKMGDWWDGISAGFTRHFIHLPNEPRFSDVGQQLRKLEAAPQHSKERAIRILKAITDGMTPEDLDLFTRKIVLDDLAWEVSQEHDLPFGLTAETMPDEKAQIDAIVAARPDILNAVRQRKLIADTVADDMVRAGVLSADRIQNPAYFRHQVLDYARAQAKFAQGTGDRLKKPYWAKREGSTLDINANYLEAEFDWLHKAMVDVAVAKTIDWIKRSDHNIRPQLIAAAAENNKSLLDAAIAQDMRVNGYTDNKGRQTSPLDEIARGFRQKIAIGMRDIQEAVEYGHLDLPAQFDGAMNAVLTGGDDPAIFPMLSHILDNNLQGAMGAATILKAISQRRAWTRSLLGDAYADPMDIDALLKRFGPAKGYATWQPDKGNLLFTAKTVPEHVIDAMLDRIAREGMDGVMPAADVRAALAEARPMMVVGGLKYQMVLPEELAATLDAIGNARAEPQLWEFLLDKPMQAWKVWTLLNPRRVLKYNLNNLSGDMDAIIAGNPGALRQFGAAARELWAVMHDKAAPSATYRDAVERGVFDSGLTVQEVPDLNDLKDFAHLLDRKSPSQAPVRWALTPVRAFWNATKRYTQFRENIMRYAAYLDFIARIEAGESQESIGYGASVPEMVDEIADPKDRAALLARDLVGDYGAVSHFGQQIRRKVVPFWSWTEINTKRYWRLTSNAYSQGVGKGIATGGALAIGMGARASAGLALRMFAMYAAVQLWNNLVMGDDEDKLDPEERARMHLLLGRGDDGEIHMLRIQGALSDALAWFGWSDAIAAAQAVEAGHGDVSDVLGTIAKAPVKKLLGGITPVITVPVEALTAKKIWPDPFNARPVRDGWRNFFATFALENEYDAVMQRPSRGYMRSLADASIYRRDTGEIAYNRVRSLAYDWLREERGQTGSGGFSTPSSDALYDWKRAKAFGDADAERRARAKLREFKVTPAEMQASIKRAAPLGALPLKDRGRFKASLAPDELAALEQARAWYNRVYLGQSDAQTTNR